MMKDSLLFDRTFKDFERMSDYAQNMIGLYDEHDNEELIEDKTEWNDDYMNKLMVDVVWNFSHERLDHLKKVVRYLRPSETPTENETNRPHTHDRGTKIALGFAVGGVIGGGIAAVAGGTALVGAIAGAVFGAGAAAIMTMTNGGNT